VWVWGVHVYIVGVVAFKQTSFTSERPGANWGIEYGFQRVSEGECGGGYGGRNWKEIRADSHQWGKAKNVT